VEGAVAITVPSFLAIAARVGAGKYAPWTQARVQLSKYLGKHLAGQMKQHSIGEHTVVGLRGQVELKQALL
jgi:hypothetical protein